MNKIFTILSLVILMSCGQKEKNEYPAEVKNNFMDNCNRTSNNNKIFCTCIFKKIQEEYSFEEFTTFELKAQAGVDTTGFLDFIGKAKAECLTE